MKHFVNNNFVCSLFFALLLSAGWSSQAKAQTTDDFSSYTTTTSGTTLGDNWVIIGNDGSWAAFGSSRDYVHYNEYGEHYVAGNSNSNYTKGVWLVLKKQVSGTVTFTATNGNQSSTFTIYVSKATQSGDSYEVTGDASSYYVPSRTSTAKTFTFEAGDAPTYVAFCLVGTSKNPKLQSVTYTEYVASSTPTLNVTDFAAGSSYDFGGVAVPAGTEKAFTLNNFGLADLTVSSIAVSGGYTITEGASISTIKSNSTATVKVATPAADATGALTITSNDPTNPTYTINLTSTYKVPAPVMGIDQTEVTFGKVTANATQDIAVSNTGDALLTTTIASNNADFTVSPASLNVAAGETGKFTITYNYNATAYGTHSAVVTVTPNVGDAMTIAVSAKVQDPNIWNEDFSGNNLPNGWTADNNWTFADGVAKAAYGSYSTAYKNYLTTPALEVAAGEEMTFQYKRASAKIIVQQQKNGGEWTDLVSLPTSGYETDAELQTYTISGLAAGNYKFRFANDDYVLDNFEGFKLSQNAPELALTPAEDADFGKVTEQPAAKTYTVENKGTGKMTVNIAASTTDFTVTPAQLKDIENGTPQTFTVTFNYNIESLGAKTADITVTPTYNESAAVTFTATATAKDPNTWAEDFEDGTMPEYWISEGAWTVSTPTATGSNGTKMATISSYNAPKSLTTPRLQASKDDELKFYIGMQYNDEPLTIEYSDDDMATWKVIESGVENYTESGDITFKAPANGQYYVRFTGTFAMLDNFEGFKMALPDHIATITASNIPSYGLKEKVSFDATVTVAESRGVEEQLTAKLYMNGEVIGTETGSVEAKGTKALTITCTPPASATDAKMYIEVTYAGGTLKTEEVTRDVAATVKLELTESMTEDITAGTYDVVTVQRTYNQGWNTILLPISVSVSKFGENAKAYAFSGYDAGALKFSSTTTLNPGTPYLLYTPDVVGDLQFTDVTIYESYLTDIAVTRDGAVLRGTWLPQAAGTLMGMYGLTGAGKIVQADETISIRGLRAYFELPADAPAPFLMVDGVATGIGAVTESHTNKEGMYNLNGQRVENAGKGVFIVNGKKVVMK